MDTPYHRIHRHCLALASIAVACAGSTLSLSQVCTPTGDALLTSYPIGYLRIEEAPEGGETLSIIARCVPARELLVSIAELDGSEIEFDQPLTTYVSIDYASKIEKPATWLRFITTLASEGQLDYRLVDGRWRVVAAVSSSTRRYDPTLSQNAVINTFTRERLSPHFSGGVDKGVVIVHGNFIPPPYKVETVKTSSKADLCINGVTVRSFILQPVEGENSAKFSLPIDGQFRSDSELLRYVNNFLYAHLLREYSDRQEALSATIEFVRSQEIVTEVLTEDNPGSFVLVKPWPSPVFVRFANSSLPCPLFYGDFDFLAGVSTSAQTIADSPRVGDLSANAFTDVSRALEQNSLVIFGAAGAELWIPAKSLKNVRECLQVAQTLDVLQAECVLAEFAEDRALARELAVNLRGAYSELVTVLGERILQESPHPSLDDAIAQLREANDRYIAQASDALAYTIDDNGQAVLKVPQPDNLLIMEKALPPMDAAVRQCLLVAFETLPDVESVQRALEGVASFEQIEPGTFDVRGGPTLPGVDTSIQMELTDADKLPRVLCWSIDSPDGERIYALQNSFVRPMWGWSRGITVPYVIHVEPSGARLSTFPELGDGAVSFTAGPPLCWFYYFLDAFSNEVAKPVLIFISYGVAQETDVTLYRMVYDPQNELWKLSESVVPEGLYKFADIYYDRETCELRYSYSLERFGESVDATLNVTDWAQREVVKSVEDRTSNVQNEHQIPQTQSGGLTCYITPPALSDDLDELILAFKHDAQTYIEFLEKQHSTGWVQWMSVWRTKTIFLDERLRDLVIGTFEQEATFDAVKRRLADIINWVEIPQKIKVSVSRDEQSVPEEMCNSTYDSLDGDTRPAVLYKSGFTSSLNPIVVFHHVFWIVDGMSFRRIRVAPYTVQDSGDEFIVCDLMDPEIPDLVPSRELSFITNELVDMGEALPWIIEMTGPSGNGNFVRLYVRSFDEERQKWQPASLGGDEWDGIRSWTYDSETMQLSLERYDEQETTGLQISTISLRDEIQNWKSTKEVSAP